MEFVSWDDDIPNWMEKYNSCSKPPTRVGTRGPIVVPDRQINATIAYHCGQLNLSWLETNALFDNQVKLVLQNPEGETTVYHAVELLNFALIEQKPLNFRARALTPVYPHLHHPNLGPSSHPPTDSLEKFDHVLPSVILT